MNALELVLTPCGSVTLPMAYQQLIQGALYHVWKDTIPELHDEGYYANGRVFRMFTFGALDGRYTLSDSAIAISSGTPPRSSAFCSLTSAATKLLPGINFERCASAFSESIYFSG